VKINLNADMGEGFGAYAIGDDAGLLGVIGAANIACGFHAGDPLVMRRAVAAARDAGVEVGAHPGFPDLQGFGRRAMALRADEVEALTVYQVGAMLGVAAAAGVRVVHVKPHGALNNMAATDAALADAIARAVAAVDRSLILLAVATSELVAAGERAGLPVACEIFADRTYTETGALTPRSEPHALLHEGGEAVAQILRFIEAGGVVTPSGRVLATPLHSVCVHGDGPTALALAREVKQGLQAAGVEVAPLSAVAG